MCFQMLPDYCLFSVARSLFISLSPSITLSLYTSIAVCFALLCKFASCYVLLGTKSLLKWHLAAHFVYPAIQSPYVPKGMSAKFDYYYYFYYYYSIFVHLLYSASWVCDVRSR